MTMTTANGMALASKIRTWLRESGQGEPNDELKSFVQDLESAQNVGTWAGVEFERILPLRISKAWYLRVLSVVRNSLVFLPIVLTWLALREAAAEFAISATEGENFLIFWQKLSGWAGLSTVALVDAVILGVLILLTLGIGVAEENDKRSIRLEKMHEGLMVALERDLSGYRSLSIQDINLAASGPLNSLLQSSQEIEKAATSFASMAQQAHDAIVGAQQAVTQDFEPVVQRLDATLTALGAAAGMHQQMGDLVQNIQRDFAAELSAVKNGFGSIVQSIDSQASRIMSNIDGQLGASVQSLSNTANTVATQLASDTVRQLQSVASQMDKSSTQMEQVVADLRATFSTVEFGTKMLREDLDDISRLLKNVVR